MSARLNLWRLPCAAALLTLSIGACSDAADPSGPSMESALARGGPNKLPPNDGRIVFASGMTGGSDIFSVNSDGTDLRRLSYTFAYEWYPTISPDGRKIAYMVNETFGHALWIMNIDGSRPLRRLEHTFAVGGLPFAWTRDGRGITYTTIEGIVTLPLHNGAAVALGVTGVSPSWSPDGNYLSYVNNGGLFSSRPDGSELTAYPGLPSCCGSQRWAPDGNSILVRTTIGTPRLYRVARDASGEFVETGVEPGAEFAWSPDAARVAFVDTQGDLWVSLANGGSATRILDGAQVTYGISWAP